MQDFIHLHVHTYYSILDGQSSVSKLVDKAVANGMRGMAITDHGNMMGVKELADYIAKIKGDAKKDLAKLEEELKEAKSQQEYNASQAALARAIYRLSARGKYVHDQKLR